MLKVVGLFVGKMDRWAGGARSSSGGSAGEEGDDGRGVAKHSEESRTLCLRSMGVIGESIVVVVVVVVIAAAAAIPLTPPHHSELSPS